MEKDEIIKFMFENGLLSIPSRRPISIDSLPAEQSTVEELPSDHPIAQYREGLMSKQALCIELGIEEEQLLRYLVERGELF